MSDGLSKKFSNYTLVLLSLRIILVLNYPQGAYYESLSLDIKSFPFFSSSYRHSLFLASLKNLEQMYKLAYCNSAATRCREQVLLTYQSTGAYDICRTRCMVHETIKF